MKRLGRVYADPEQSKRNNDDGQVTLSEFHIGDRLDVSIMAAKV
jgi:hypothetical protein